jgi:hypothetical protein
MAEFHLAQAWRRGSTIQTSPWLSTVAKTRGDRKTRSLICTAPVPEFADARGKAEDWRSKNDGCYDEERTVERSARSRDRADAADNVTETTMAPPAIGARPENLTFDGPKIASLYHSRSSHLPLDKRSGQVRFNYNEY